MDEQLHLPGSCRLLRLPVRGDERGKLIPIEAADAGFDIERVYYIYGTPADAERGFHAHKELRQIAMAVSGTCSIELDDGREKASVTIDHPSVGLTIEPMVWHVMRDFSEDCVLLLIASAAYDEADYIRDYERFLTVAAEA